MKCSNSRRDRTGKHRCIENVVPHAEATTEELREESNRHVAQVERQAEREDHGAHRLREDSRGSTAIDTLTPCSAPASEPRCCSALRWRRAGVRLQRLLLRRVSSTRM